MQSIGILGCGRMGQAIALGHLRQAAPTPLWVFDPRPAASADLLEQARALGKDHLVHLVTTPEQALADATVLAVKPDVVPALLTALANAPESLLISIVAGTELAALRRHSHHRIIRAMPNTPALCGAGVTVMLHQADDRPTDRSRAEAVFSALGPVLSVADEALMHVVTALTGSGPAFFAVAIEALSDAAVAQGLPRTAALEMARLTMHGTAALLAEWHPALLKDAVTSPGGTTAAGLAAAEAAGLRHALMETLRAATLRSRDIAREKNQT